MVFPAVFVHVWGWYNITFVDLGGWWDFVVLL